LRCPLKSKVKIGVVVKECNRPEEFEALEIREGSKIGAYTRRMARLKGGQRFNLKNYNFFNSFGRRALRPLTGRTN